MVNIKKKEIKGKPYYYLEHSYREKGRIKKKEKYLGTEIPKNIEQITNLFRSELEKNLYKKLELIKKDFQLEWKRIPESVKQKQKEEISIAFTYNTNAIEGSTITLEETRGIIHDKIAPNKSLRDVRETEAHSKVFLNMLDKKEKISKELLLKWHREMFRETKSDISGRYRDYLVRVGSHLAPDWQEIESLMNHLFKFLETNKKINPVELAGRVHYHFEKIHPFGDGNGRIGRLLMNHILWYSGYPMLIIEYTKRKSYYKALQKDEEAFISYFIRRYLAVHKSRLKLG
ncbi:Fic family protein [Candidatus Pacearchaeota archaeon]|nr:Fic family protein [Candidatus Pacearchaeota archaeon]